MDSKVITFFNNKGGVGKTTTVYHIAWMLSEMGHKVLAVDLDPQSNLSSMFLSPEVMEAIVLGEEAGKTVLEAIEPVSEGEPYAPVHIEKVGANIGHIVGNLALSAFEDKLSDAWNKCLAGEVYGFKVTSVFNTLFRDAAKRFQAEFVLVDVGPNLGAINRAILISTDFVVLPVGSDMFSLQGMKNLGETLQKWRREWAKRKSENPKPETLLLPDGEMKPIGYVLMQYNARASRPVKSYLHWADRIPAIYAKFMLNQVKADSSGSEPDAHCLALLKHYHSLAPMSMSAQKPIFLLKPADGAIGAHVEAVRRSYQDFESLAKNILNAM